MTRNLLDVLLSLILLCSLGAVASAQSYEDRVVSKAKKLDVLDHGDLVLRLRKELDKRLLTPEPKYLSPTQKKVEGRGVNRILVRGRWERQTFVRGGGAYFSFETSSNDYDQRPDIKLSSEWTLSSGFAGGDFGVVVPMQGGKIEDIELDNLPQWMVETDAAGLNKIVRSDRPDNPEATVGRIYAVRSVRYRESDRIALLKVLARGEFGITFAWKVLETRAIPRR